MNDHTGRLERKTTDNKGLAKVAVQWLIEHLCFVSSAVLADSFVLRIRHLRQAPNRWRQVYTNNRQQINYESKLNENED